MSLTWQALAQGSLVLANRWSLPILPRADHLQFLNAPPLLFVFVFGNILTPRVLVGMALGTAAGVAAGTAAGVAVGMAAACVTPGLVALGAGAGAQVQVVLGPLLFVMVPPVLRLLVVVTVLGGPCAPGTVAADFWGGGGGFESGRAYMPGGNVPRK